MTKIIQISPIAPYTIQFAEEEPQPLAALDFSLVVRAKAIVESRLGHQLPVGPLGFPSFVVYNTDGEEVLLL